MTTFEIGLSVFVVAMVASPLVAAIVSGRRRRQRAIRRKGLAVGCYHGALVVVGVVGVMALSSAVPVMHLAPCVCGVSAFALLGPFIAGAILLPAARSLA